ncbi:MAG: acyl-CoA thioesterase [Spirochaetia bacterium]|nr:acyl-CoA thioesterase [Spirochaetia bacterium]
MRLKETSIEYRVPYADTDQMKVVYYANYLVYFERVRNEIMRKDGLTYRKFEEDGYFLPAAEAHVEYHRPSQYDDLLTIRGWISLAKGCRLKIDYEVKRGDDLLVTGYTVHALINKTGKPCRFPRKMLEWMDID